MSSFPGPPELDLLVKDCRSKMLSYRCQKTVSNSDCFDQARTVLEKRMYAKSLHALMSVYKFGDFIGCRHSASVCRQVASVVPHAGKLFEILIRVVAFEEVCRGGTTETAVYCELCVAETRQQ